MNQTTAFVCPHQEVAFTKSVEHSSVAVILPERRPSHGIQDLLAFHQAVPQDGHAPEHVLLPDGRTCAVKVYEADDWRQARQRLVEIAEVSDQVTIFHHRMNPEQRSYFALDPPLPDEQPAAP